MLTRGGLWPMRVVWVLLALAGSLAADEALTGRSGAVQVTTATLAWVAWTVVGVALLVPRTSSLTVARVLVPGGLLATVAFAATADSPGPAALAAVVLAAFAVVLCFAPWVTDAFVDGSSYGAERRFSLRTPLVVAAVATITEAAVLAGIVVGPLAVATGRTVAGVAGGALGIGVAIVGIRAIHQLSERWLVLVPTGLVLHDPLTMPEPQLFLRQTMAHLGPAGSAADQRDEVEDLTAGAAGLAIELVLDEPVELLVNRTGGDAQTRSVGQVLFTPSRPAALLAAAGSNRLPVG